MFKIWRQNWADDGSRMHIKIQSYALDVVMLKISASTYIKVCTSAYDLVDLTEKKRKSRQR